LEYIWVFHLLSLSFTFFRIHDQHSHKPTAFHTIKLYQNGLFIKWFFMADPSVPSGLWFSMVSKNCFFLYFFSIFVFSCLLLMRWHPFYSISFLINISNKTSFIVQILSLQLFCSICFKWECKMMHVVLFSLIRTVSCVLDFYAGNQ